jgi:hypothetical protein
MTNKEIDEGNRLIAEYMGYKIWYGNGTQINVETSPQRCQPIREWAEYYTDWNWLMPCIGKISNQCEEPDELDNLKYALLTNNIEEAYKFVVNYIENEQK